MFGGLSTDPVNVFCFSALGLSLPSNEVGAQQRQHEHGDYPQGIEQSRDLLEGRQLGARSKERVCAHEVSIHSMHPLCFHHQMMPWRMFYCKGRSASSGGSPLNGNGIHQSLHEGRR